MCIIQRWIIPKKEILESQFDDFYCDRVKTYMATAEEKTKQLEVQLGAVEEEARERYVAT